MRHIWNVIKENAIWLLIGLFYLYILLGEVGRSRR